MSAGGIWVRTGEDIQSLNGRADYEHSVKTRHTDKCIDIISERKTKARGPTPEAVFC